MHSRRTSLSLMTRSPAAAPAPAAEDQSLPDDVLEWSWPPYAPLAVEGEPFDTNEWAPPSVVWHPQLRLGRWAVVYRR